MPRPLERRRANTDKQYFAGLDPVSEVFREPESPFADGFRNHSIQERFVDGDLALLEKCNFFPIIIHANNGIPRVSETRRRHESDVANTDDADLHRAISEFQPLALLR